MVAGPGHGHYGTPGTDWLEWLGRYLLGALVTILGAFTIQTRGAGSWRATDAAEPEQICRDVVGPAGQA